MIETIIRFDRTVLGWSPDADITKAYLNMQVKYIKEMQSHLGYIYLSRIHEMLGVRWHPGDINYCYIADFDLHIDIVQSEEPDVFLIKIYQD